MNAVLQPHYLEFNRGSVLGHLIRIQKLYGHSVLGLRIYLAYSEAHGGPDQILRASLGRARAHGLSGHAATCEACSSSWYARRAMTRADRIRAEHDAREARGELYDEIDGRWYRPVLTRRQAS
jgi:hypothetical protein